MQRYSDFCRADDVWADSVRLSRSAGECLRRRQRRRWYNDQAYVAAISIGVGGGAGSGYRAFADNVVFNTTVSDGDRTFDFETQLQQVPEPVSLALAGWHWLAWR